LLELVAPAGPVYQAGTLSANPVGMRAGLATLQKVEREKVFEKLEKRAAGFVSALGQGFERANLPLSIVRQGSVFWMHSYTDGAVRRLAQIPKDHGAQFKAFFHSCAERGVYLAPSGYEVGFLGYAHGEAMLEEAAAKIVAAAQATYGARA